jgi:peptidoglycan/xylan/chitin deacetylase (PgdA/CDA1 family)
MLLFSIGFISGIKILNKSDIAKGQVGNNTPLQGNKDTSADENKDKPEDPVNPADSDPNIGGNNGDSPQKDDPNNVVTTPNNPNVDPKPTDAAPDKKEVFLTFDDGPTANITPRILKTLDDYNVKATFFVIGKNAERYPELIKQAHASGHLIANHTYSHDYNFIYSSPDNFLIDLEKSNKVLASILGSFNNKVIRFPGGSFGTKRAAYREAVTKAGYKYVDWNSLNGDAADSKRSTIPSAELVQNLKDSVNNMNPKNKNHVVVLMHDASTKSTTADSLPEVIKFLKSLGYEFKTLDE